MCKSITTSSANDGDDRLHRVRLTCDDELSPTAWVSQPQEPPPFCIDSHLPSCRSWAPASAPSERSRGTGRLDLPNSDEPVTAQCAGRGPTRPGFRRGYLDNDPN